MTKRERALLGEVYTCLNTMGGLSPSNPADIRAKSENLRTCTDAAVELQYAVFNVIAGEHAEAVERLARAKRRLGLDRIAAGGP